MHTTVGEISLLISVVLSLALLSRSSRIYPPLKLVPRASALILCTLFTITSSPKITSAANPARKGGRERKHRPSTDPFIPTGGSRDSWPGDATAAFISRFPIFQLLFVSVSIHCPLCWSPIRLSTARLHTLSTSWRVSLSCLTNIGLELGPNAKCIGLRPSTTF